MTISTRVWLVLAGALLAICSVAAAPASAASTPTALPAAPIAQGICDTPGAATKLLCGAAKLGGKVLRESPVGAGAAVAAKATPLAMRAQETLKQFTPAGIVDEWAKSAAVGSTELLATLQKQLLDSTKPELRGADWWGSRYAVCYALGLVVMAFSLTAAMGRLARGGPEAALLAREAMSRAVLYVPVVVAMPALVMIGVDAVNALAHWFGTETAPEAGSAIKVYVDTMAEMNDVGGLSGGALTLLVFAGIIFLAAVVALFELAFAGFAVYLLTLLFPILAGLAVNPRWRGAAFKLMGGLAGALLTPAALFFGFWVLWGAFGGSRAAEPGADRFGLLVFVAVGTIACVSAPIVLGMVVGNLIAGGGHDTMAGSRAVRTAAPTPGAVTQSTVRALTLMGRRGGGGGVPSRDRPYQPPVSRPSARPPGSSRPPGGPPRPPDPGRDPGRPGPVPQRRQPGPGQPPDRQGPQRRPVVWPPWEPTGPDNGAPGAGGGAGWKADAR